MYYYGISIIAREKSGEPFSIHHLEADMTHTLPTLPSTLPSSNHHQGLSRPQTSGESFLPSFQANGRRPKTSSNSNQQAPGVSSLRPSHSASNLKADIWSAEIEGEQSQNPLNPSQCWQEVPQGSSSFKGQNKPKTPNVNIYVHEDVAENYEDYQTEDYYSSSFDNNYQSIRFLDEGQDSQPRVGSPLPASRMNPMKSEPGSQPALVLGPGDLDPNSPSSQALLLVGLRRLADVLARQILPWQAVCCPRAIETLRDLRWDIIRQRHTSFMQRMKDQLQSKVMDFLTRKQEEVDHWVDTEVQAWQYSLTSEEKKMQQYLYQDSQRQAQRNTNQAEARGVREVEASLEVEDREREKTREQLIQFRRICQSGFVNSEQTAEDEPNNNKSNQLKGSVEARMLKSNMEAARMKATSSLEVGNRERTRRLEECHEWLCCLADNALTANLSENYLQTLYDSLDQEKKRGLTALENAKETYKQQQHAIVEAITVFAG